MLRARLALVSQKVTRARSMSTSCRFSFSISPQRAQLSSRNTNRSAAAGWPMARNASQKAVISCSVKVRSLVLRLVSCRGMAGMAARWPCSTASENMARRHEVLALTVPGRLPRCSSSWRHSFTIGAVMLPS